MPDWSGEIRRRLSGVRLPPEREAAIVDEVAQHLEDRYQTLLASGQPAAEAERRAWRSSKGTTSSVACFRQTNLLNGRASPVSKSPLKAVCS